MSFWRNYYHLVWTTKNRESLILPAFEDQLYSYMINKAAELDVHVYALNGCTDHAHTALAIPPKCSVADLVKLVKGASAHYVNHVIRPGYHFGWQRGYGSFTMGEKYRHIAVAYVENQKKHHKEQTTNAWLERYAEIDEGPADIGLRPGEVSRFIRDELASYEVLGEPPF